jgi:hypothetical protein
MNPIKRLIVAVAAFTAVAAAGTVTFTLDPSNGSLEGAAGTSVGWGYTITDDDHGGSTTFVSIESFSFGDETPVGVFCPSDDSESCLPLIGVPSNEISEHSPLTVPWVSDISGLQYDIGAGALVGALTQGVMTLTYDVYSDAEMNTEIGFGLQVYAQINGNNGNAKVSVNAPAATVPEPGAVTLFVLGAAGLLLRKWSLKLHRAAPASLG